MKNTARSFLSKEAVKEAKGVDIHFHNEEPKYTRQAFAQIYKGYDFLENLFTVRTYIQKHYNIDFPHLELLLKLMGMRVFTRIEYSEIPRDYGFNRFNTFLREGHIVVLSTHNKVEMRLFTLSTKSKNIVTNFYAYLSGEKKIPEDYVNNPMFNSNKRVAYDKKKAELIKKMNKLPMSPHNKKLLG